MRKIVIIVVVVAVIAGGGYALLSPRSQAGGSAGNTGSAAGQGGAAGGGGGRGNQAGISGRATIDVGDILVTVTATGSLVASQQSVLTFDSTGIVKQVLVEEGQHVDAGQTLALLDDSSQQALVKQAQLSLQAAQATLDKILQPVDAD